MVAHKATTLKTLRKSAILPPHSREIVERNCHDLHQFGCRTKMQSLLPGNDDLNVSHSGI
jgi:hypothetical protein